MRFWCATDSAFPFLDLVSKAPPNNFFLSWNPCFPFIPNPPYSDHCCPLTLRRSCFNDINFWLKVLLTKQLRPDIRLLFSACHQHVLPGRPWATLRGFSFSFIKFRGLPFQGTVRIKYYTRCEKCLHIAWHITGAQQIIVYSLPFLDPCLYLWWIQNPYCNPFSTDLPPHIPVELQKPHPHSISTPPQSYPQISQYWNPS